MKRISGAGGSGRLQRCGLFGGLVLVLGLWVRIAGAQASSTDAKPAEVKTEGDAYRTFYLTSMTEQREAADVVTDPVNVRGIEHLGHRRVAVRVPLVGVTW